MVEILVPFALFVCLSVVLIGVTKVVSDNRTRRRLIETQATPELASAIMSQPVRDPGLWEALRWGMVLGSVGLALVVVQFLPYRMDQPIVTGVILLFGAGGLLAYYAAARRMSARAH